MSIKKHIPNTITCCNLISGCIATSFAFGGNPEMALLWIIIGAVFDFFDGMSARLLHVSSPIGKELDSLADDVTFGVAPATIVFSQLFVMEYPEFLEPLRPWLPYAAFTKPDAFSKEASRGRRIASMISVGTGAFDGALLAWKLYRKFKGKK